MPRLFIGLQIPTTHRTALSFLQMGLVGARWIEPSDLHITLRFIGDVDNRQANEIVETLGRHKMSAPEINIGELRSFGGRKPRTVFASVKENAQLLQLNSSLEQMLQQLRHAPDGRKYTPHITLARGSSLKYEKVAHYLAQFGGFSSPAFVPKHVTLYSARDSVGGGPYHALNHFAFSKATDAEK